MKKITLIFFSIIILTSCSIINKGEAEIKQNIVKNMEKIVDKASKVKDYDYVKNRYFKRIVKVGKPAIKILSELYYNGELDETRSYVAAFAIQEISGCNVLEQYNLSWESPDEFFEIWKNNNCSFKDKNEEYFVADDVESLREKYKEFSNIAIECKINIPIFKEMIPQGITLMNDYILITAYDSQDKTNSKCYVLNKNGEIKNIVTLDTNSHVGSIDYDKKRDLLWIPGNDGRLNIYRGREFLEKKEVKSVLKVDNLSKGLVHYKDSSKNEIAYLCIDDDNLFIGSFSVLNKGFVKRYKITVGDRDDVVLSFVNEFNVPPKIQGLTFYVKDNIKYMLLSSSYGRASSSSLIVYQYDEEIKDYTNSKVIKSSVKLPPMLEQISMKDNLYSVFESNAAKYSNCSEKIGSVCLLDVDKIINKYDEKRKIKEKELEEKKLKELEEKKQKSKNEKKKK